MKELTVSAQLRTNYESYYETEGSEWRWLGALGKCENIVSLCGGLPHRSVLEIGAGEGSILKRLSQLNFAEQFCALEISSSAVEAIKKRGIPELVECGLFDGYSVPYEQQRFDLAILSHVIEHVEFPRRLLHEASRVARFVFVEVPLEDTVRLPEDYVFDAVGHINFYSPKTFRRLVQTCGLKVLKQTITNPSKATYVYKKGRSGLINYYVKGFLLKVLPGLATRVFTYHSSLVCEMAEWTES